MSHFDEAFFNAPAMLTFSDADHPEVDGKVSLLIKGQGTLALKNPSTRSFYINLVAGENTLSFQINEKEARLYLMENGSEKLIETYDVRMIQPEDAKYWYSFDSLSKVIKFGMGEVRNDLKMLTQQLEIDWLEKVEAFHISSTAIPTELYRDPIVYDPSLLVKPTDDITIDDIAYNNYIVPANLTPSCQALYANISGKNFNLNTSDFPDFVDAIEASIKNPAGWCYQELAKKATEFGEDNPDETYLRITLGANQGDSPGIPFVLEIWPPGHYSPIHNHANANAVIRVLHGEITVKLFPMLSKYHEQPFKQKVFRKDDVTWISPRYNQTHQLVNVNKSGPTCITIQCYLYGEDNHQHYKYFDYLGEDGKIAQFTPNSDASYLEFKEIMRKEWMAEKDTIFAPQASEKATLTN